MPAAWAIRPQFGSRPKRAVLTSGELAIARATRSASLGDRGSARLDPARTASRPRRRRRPRARAGAAPRRAGRPGSGSPARAARLQQDRVVGAHLPVDGDPLERGVDRVAEGALGLADDGVGLHEAEHGGEAGLDHPRALGLGGERHAARRARSSASGQRSVVTIASENAAPPASDSALAVASMPPEHRLDVERHADRPGLGDRDGRRLDPERGRRSAPASRRRRGTPARRSPRWRCPS